MEDAWHRFNGGKLLVRLALQMFATGYAGDTFKAGFGDHKRILTEDEKTSKPRKMPELVWKCIKTIYDVNTYNTHISAMTCGIVKDTNI